MKTKELIRQLMEADPSGEEEVCVGNCDIHFVESLPAYYDGTLQVLIRDNSKPFSKTIGAKYRRSGVKINIHTLSISDAISNNHEVYHNIDYSELNQESQIATKKAHEKLLEWHKKIDNQLEWENFLKWAKIEAEKITADTDDVESVAKRFFDDNINPDDPIGDMTGHSYVSMRKEQWSQNFEFWLNEGFLELRKKQNANDVV